MNCLKGTLRLNGKAEFEGPGGIMLPVASVPRNTDGRPTVYGIRPEHFVIADDGAEVEVQIVEPTGSETQVLMRIGGQAVIGAFRERVSAKPGETIRITPDTSLVHLFDAGTGLRLAG